jgi:opacity protein-like surface antigen
MPRIAIPALSCSLIASALLSPAASAASLAALAGYPDFSIDFSARRIDVSFADEADTLRELELYTLSFSVAEPLSEHFRLRLFGGNSGINLDDRASTDGLDITGHFLGLSGEWRVSLGSNLHATTELAVARHQLSRSDNGEQLDIDWNQANGALGLGVQLAPALEMTVGGAMIYLNGKEQRSGAINSSTNFENPDSTSGWVSLTWLIGRSGRISLRAHGGAQDSLSIRFQRQY